MKHRDVLKQKCHTHEQAARDQRRALIRLTHIRFGSTPLLLRMHIEWSII